MRLAILDKGHGIGAKVLFTMIRLFSGQRVVDAVKLVTYRPDFYGNPMKLAREHAVDADDMNRVLAAGVSPAQIKDALAVSLAFNVTDRLADVFQFALASAKAFEAGAKFLLARGYR